jgi:hypothetical protein
MLSLRFGLLFGRPVKILGRFLCFDRHLLRHRGVWTMAIEPIESRGGFWRCQWGSLAPAHQKSFSRDNFSQFWLTQSCLNDND